MIVRTYYLSCLSQASYLIADEVSGRAAVIDPRRDAGEYVKEAERLGVRICYIIQTHLHADFLSGHLELADATGAQIVFGEAAPIEFQALKVSDGAWLELGGVRLQILSTPGHTPESICITAYDTPLATQPICVFTGDTLFIGDVGRPDLLSSVGFKAEDLASSLYVALHGKLMTLPDNVVIYPAHGAGSACGRSLSTDLTSTIGEQKALNYALQPMPEDAFVAAVLSGQPAAPGYFVFDAITNRKAHPLFDESLLPTPLSLAALDTAVDSGAVVVDARTEVDYATGHLHGSLNVSIEGRFAEIVGSVVRPGTPIVLMCPQGREHEAVIRLARIGFDNVIGYLAEPIDILTGNPERVEGSSRLTAAQLREALRSVDGIQLVDVRNPAELLVGTIEDSVPVPLGALARSLDSLDPVRPTVVYCAGGFRSSTAASLLRKQGFDDVSDLLGGYTAWQAALC
jgi:glyoxylase-like metal-dependent hydrolase (beta-lactamase superfamily II)/rhodanese-related sulfurtransferase